VDKNNSHLNKYIAHRKVIPKYTPSNVIMKVMCATMEPLTNLDLITLARDNSNEFALQDNTIYD